MKKLVLLMIATFLIGLGCSHLPLVSQKKYKNDMAEMSMEIAKMQKRLNKLRGDKIESSHNLVNATNEINDLKKKLDIYKRELMRLQKMRNTLAQILESEIRKGKALINIVNGKIYVSINDAVLFDSGKNKLKPEAKKILNKLSKFIKKIDNRVIVEGHTDTDPIKHSKWQDNWQLSTERALSVLRYLIKTGVKPQKLSAHGYGPYDPRVTAKDFSKNKKSTDKFVKKMNRRVDLVFDPAWEKTKKKFDSGLVNKKHKKECDKCDKKDCDKKCDEEKCDKKEKSN